ncbi:MAG: FHA domain-containing protein [Chloroflexota bacterium]
MITIHRWLAIWVLCIMYILITPQVHAQEDVEFDQSTEQSTEQGIAPSSEQSTETNSESNADPSAEQDTGSSTGSDAQSSSESSTEENSLQGSDLDTQQNSDLAQSVGEIEPTALNAPAGEISLVEQSDSAALATEADPTQQTPPSDAQADNGSDEIQVPGTSIFLPRDTILLIVGGLFLLLIYLLYMEISERRAKRVRWAENENLQSDHFSGGGNYSAGDHYEGNYGAGDHYEGNYGAGNHNGGNYGAGNHNRGNYGGEAEISFEHAYRRSPTPYGQQEYREGEMEIHDAATWEPRGDQRSLLPEPASIHVDPAYGYEHPVGRRDVADYFGGTSSSSLDEEGMDDDSMTMTPSIPMDDLNTFRLVEDTPIPIFGHLVRLSKDPELPEKLAIYRLNSPNGEVRQTFIGRHSKHNTHVIKHHYISREHAVIVQRGDRLYIRDNESRTGTYLNGIRLASEQELLIRDNDEIVFGTIGYTFQAEDNLEIMNSMPIIKRQDV